jgi:hypothetical protein
VPALLIAAGEPSKVPLYIIGGLLVVWALSLAALGLTRPAFPYSARGARQRGPDARDDGHGRPHERFPEVVRVRRSDAQSAGAAPATPTAA